MDKENLINLTKKTYQLTLLFPKQEPLRRRIRETADDILAGLIMSQKTKNDISLLRGYFEVIDSFLEVAISQNWTMPAAINEIKNSYAALKAEFEQNSANLMLEAKKSHSEMSQPPASAEEFLQENFQEEREEKNVEIKENIIYAPPASAMPLIGQQLSELKNEPAPMDSMPLDFQQEKKEANEQENEQEKKEESDSSFKSVKEELTESQIVRQNRIVEFLKQKGRAQVWEIQKIFPDISKRTIRRDFRSLLEQGLIERVGERNKTYYKMKVHFS